MSLKVADCETDEVDAMERHQKAVALGRGMWEPTFRVVTVEGHACFARFQGQVFVLFESNARRYDLVAKALSDAMRTALSGVGYGEDDLLNNGCGVQMVVNCVVHDTSDHEVYAKSVNVTARKGSGHVCIALDVNDQSNAALYAELNDDEGFCEEARSYARH